MKKFIFTIMMGCSLGLAAESLPTDDYLYATEIKQDGSSYYFEVVLDGSNYYTAYGIDIQLPTGLEVVTARGGSPKITMDTNGAMYNDSEGFTEHSLSMAFPNSNDHTHARVGCLSNGNYDMAQTSGTLFRVYVTKTCTSTQWPIGAIKLYDVELNKVGQPYISPVQYNTVTMFEGTSTLPLKVSATNHWSTCILPFDAALPDGVKAYTSATHDAENIFLAEATSLSAYTPYVLYSENGYNGTVTGTVTASECPANIAITAGNLNGAIVEQNVTQGYILQNHNDVVKFYAIGADDSFTIPAGKCWMIIPGNESKALNFIIDGNETAIQNVKVAGSQNITYDLTGRRVRTLKQGGLYIKNGEKFIGK